MTAQYNEGQGLNPFLSIGPWQGLTLSETHLKSALCAKLACLCKDRSNEPVPIFILFVLPAISDVDHTFPLPLLSSLGSYDI